MHNWDPTLSRLYLIIFVNMFNHVQPDIETLQPQCKTGQPIGQLESKR